MQIQKKLFLSIFISLVLFLISNNVSAKIFCNMDKAGGDKALEAQQQSAYAAGIFLMSASDTFEMFSEIEYLISGRKKPNGKEPSIAFARDLCGGVIENLGTAREDFTKLTDESLSKAIASVNDALDKKIQDPAYLQEIFKEAHVAMDSPVAQFVMKEYNNKKTIGLINVIVSEIDKVLISMNKVNKNLGNGKVPEVKILWEAAFDWNNTFYVGRIIAAFFKVR